MNLKFDLGPGLAGTVPVVGRTALFHSPRRGTFPCQGFGSKFTIKLFAISFKLEFSSGIRELIDAQFYKSFFLCKVN